MDDLYAKAVAWLCGIEAKFIRQDTLANRFGLSLKQGFELECQLEEAGILGPCVFPRNIRRNRVAKRVGRDAARFKRGKKVSKK